MNKKIEQIKKIQSLLEHRTKVEAAAEQLIIDGEYEKAVEILNSLDAENADEKIEEINKQIDDIQRIMKDVALLVEPKRYRLYVNKKIEQLNQKWGHLKREIFLETTNRTK